MRAGLLGRRRAATRWDTLTPAHTGERRRVLAVARTVTSLGRLLDVVPILDGDLRVEVEFTVSEGSAFQDGVGEFLQALGVKLRPWRQAVRTRYDLALAATSNGGLHRLRAPLLVMPHGAGHNRLVSPATGSREIASGFSHRQLLHRGRVVPAMIALSHHEQLARLRRACPRAAERATVVGDPCFDRMVASLALRDRYRTALGAADGRRLLVITSTWGRDSLFGSRPGLLARWVAELPVEEFGVALILHPNVWFRYGPMRVRGWLAEAMHAGLMLIPPQEGWRAALIAADWVVGDHGSVTYYAASLERPTLLAAFGAGELDPESPLASLGESHPRLDPRLGLRAQLENLKAVPVAADALGMRGQALQNLRTAMYGLMRLEPPPTPPRLTPIPEPEPESRPVTALLVDAEMRGNDVSLSRRPAIVDSRPESDAHLLVDEREVDPRLLESADIFVRRLKAPGGHAWAASRLDSHRGALLAAAAFTDRRTIVVTSTGEQAVVTGAPVDICASAVYARLVNGLPSLGSWNVQTGGKQFRIQGTPPGR